MQQPLNWNTYYLKDVSLINPKTADLPDLFNYIDLESVESGILKLKKIISKEEAPSRAKRVLSKEDILFQMVRPYQKNNLFFNFDDMKYVASTGYAQIRAKDFIYPLFLYYLLHTDKFVNNVLARCTGTSYPSINSNDLKKIKVKIPNLITQQKIGNFLSLIDKKIGLLEKKHKNIREFKKYFIQKLRWNQIKFKNENNENYSDWKELKLKEVLFEHKLKSTGNEEIYSVSVHKGVINQIEHLGRSFASDDLFRYKLAKPGDIIYTKSYTKSPTAGFELGIIKQNKNNINVLVSPLYGVFTPKTKELGNYLDCYFESQINTRNYLHPIVQKGAKNTMNISNEVFLSKSLLLPSDFEEQQKISNSIDLINFKEENIVEMLENLQDFKKGLLQKMFV